MKKICILLALIMVLGIMPLNVFAEPTPNVTLVGQWVDDCSRKIDTPKHYNLDDEIGNPPVSGGLLNKMAKNFLCWTDKPIVGNAKLADGARIFSPKDTIKDVFPNGIPEGAKLYAVYYELFDYDKPFKFGDLKDKIMNKLLTGSDESIFDPIVETSANNNSVFINKNVLPKDVLTKTENYKPGENGEYNLGDVIVDYYSIKDDVNDINEVVLKSEFEMDWAVAMLAYRNETVSSQLLPILSRDYGKRYKDSDFPKSDGWYAGYTYVDLNMDFGTDEGLVIPENLFLEFKSYAWRPLYAFGIKPDGKKDTLNILDMSGKTIGNGTDAFKGLVSGDKPETAFGVETKEYRKITIRVVLRQWDDTVAKPHLNPFSGERIPESKIPKKTNGTIASEIVSNMTLNVLGSKESIKPENIVKITDKKAKELADGEATDNIQITGSINGHVFSNAGSANVYVPFLNTNIDFELKYDTPINKCDVKNPVKLSYIHKKEEPKPEPNPEKLKDEGQIIFFAKPKTEEKKVEKFNHIAYIEGYEDNTVRANGKLTRAEAAAMVTRLAEHDLSNKTKADYKDLEDNAWYLPYINAALKASMLDAEDGNLRPNDNITRAEFAKMLAAIDKDNNYVSEFKDIAGHKYEKEINKITGNKRVEGYEDGTFRPDGYLTRAEAACFLNRMFDRVADDVAIKGFENIIIHFNDLNVGDWYYYEIVEASNTHELFRRGGTDKFDRAYEEWTNVFNTKVR